MKCNSRLVLLMSLFIIYIKTESINTDFDITPLAGCPGYNNDPNNNYTNLVDKDETTNWLANSCTFEEGQEKVWYVSFTTSRPVEVGGYEITLSGINYHENNPKSWILKAKERENQNWKDIDERDYPMTNEYGYKNFIFNVNKPGKYQYFAFVVTSLQTGNKNGFITLGELSLILSCPNDDIAPKMGCMCGENGNICEEGQKCYSGDCYFLSACPNDEIVPKMGCICGTDGNVCKEGQKCNVVVCLYPPPTLVSVIVLIIGLFFALTLVLVCFIL